MATIQDMRKVADVTAHGKNMNTLMVIQRQLESARASLSQNVSLTEGTMKIMSLIDDAIKECDYERGRERIAYDKAYAKLKEII